jgi:hypothetical protein
VRVRRNNLLTPLPNSLSSFRPHVYAGQAASATGELNSLWSRNVSETPDPQRLDTRECLCNTLVPLAPVRKVTTFRIDDELLVAMDELKERDGIAYSEQIRRALRMFLESKGAKVKAAPRRAATRRKA